MSIGVIVEFNLKPEGTALMTETMKERLPETRKWDGCDYVYLQAAQDDPNHLYLVERWASREQYDTYREWAMAQPGTEKIVEHLIGEMKTTYLDDTGA
ncbi:MAG: antibiotic biosynthesis monooxygenase family protein [Anaerolineae bacterium]|nr:antibiotic biosynthesis monooxygenase family protein [Anaerolineae bacterium]